MCSNTRMKVKVMYYFTLGLSFLLNFFFVFQNSGQEFHEDLYPDTVGTTPAMSAEEWWKGGNKQVRELPSPQVCPVLTSHRQLKLPVLFHF